MATPKRPRTVASQFISTLTRVSDPQSALELAGILAAWKSNPEKSASMPATRLLKAWLYPI
jgi:hypothetical protein